MQLRRIRIHPVKSLTGVDVRCAGVTPSGFLRDDRRWCLVRQDADDVTPDSVYMTKVDKNGDASALARTRVHHGSTLGVMSLELDGHVSPEFRLPEDSDAMSIWCSGQYGVALRVEESTDHGWPDVTVYGSKEEYMAVSGPTVISTATLAYLSDRLALSPEELLLRFRTNLLVHDDDLPPFGEDELTEITLGDVRLAVVGRVTRCPVPGRDVTSGRYDRTFTKRFVEAKSECSVGKSLERSELYTASVFTRVITPHAALSVAADTAHNDEEINAGNVGIDNDNYDLGAQLHKWLILVYTPPAMSMVKEDKAAAIERQSLELGKWGNLLMAIAGIGAAYWSHSDALLVDGLYSGVNFFSAMVAARVGAAILLPADRRYPFGYAAYEALYVKFRSMVLLGIMAFAVFGALQKITTYATGGVVPALVFGPIMIYAVVMVLICAALAAWHHYNWQRSGKRSEILTTESKAAIVDGVISGGAGGGLVAASFLQGTMLEFIVPVADSVVVLIMTAFIIRQPVQMFLRSMREVAGAAVEPAVVERVKTQIEGFLSDQPFVIVGLAVTKLGRTQFVVAYVKPESPVDGIEADKLRLALEAACTEILGATQAELIITASPPYEP